MKKYRVVAWTKRFSFVWNFNRLKIAEFFMNLKIFRHAQIYDLTSKRCINIKEGQA